MASRTYAVGTCRTLIISLLGLGALCTMQEGSSERKSKSMEWVGKNRLSDQTSPYLLQHADNPVNWHPWGDEAFEQARAQNKPVFLSIGYAACHWCHVMERESFENAEIASLLNTHFISIKVDREQRPDVDEIYMNAVQLMTGTGGWPLTVFLTPDKKPFYGGTYFPPRDRENQMGLISLLSAVASAWKSEQNKILSNASDVTIAMTQYAATLQGDKNTQAKLTAEVLDKATRKLATIFDPDEGGFGEEPKFPQPMAVEILLRQSSNRDYTQPIAMTVLTLQKMARGGIFDHIGGGFHRYATDKKWRVPHFEKMLYDNALLCDSYLHAYQATGEELFGSTARHILDYVRREMTHPKGGFFSTQDADSEGKEGMFYLWSREEILNILGEEQGKVFIDFFNVRQEGNFSSPQEYHSGKNILFRNDSENLLAEKHGLTTKQLLQLVSNGSHALLKERSGRVHPTKDDKIITAWNGMMISAFTHGYQILREERYRDIAEKAAFFLLDSLYDGKNLRHMYRAGRADSTAFLEDYAALIIAFIDLYETTFDHKWLVRAETLTERMIRLFWDKNDGGFFFRPLTEPAIITRLKPANDGSTPSGNALAASALLRLSVFLDNNDYRTKAETILRMHIENMMTNPLAYASMISALDFYIQTPLEIAIAGEPDAADTRHLLSTLHKQYIPNKIVALVSPNQVHGTDIQDYIPLLSGKGLINQRATAYVCQNYSCGPPVTNPNSFRDMLVGRTTTRR
ncbi:MAG: thioredoxin domain-containing protein [Chitinispirillaceae bacterium]